MSAKIEELRQKIEPSLREMSKHDIESIITLCNRYLKERFIKRRKPKRGNLSPYMTKSKFQELLSATTNQKYRFIFCIMRKLALRVGEVPKIRLEDINLERKQIFIPCTEKSHLPDMCYLDDEGTSMLKAWINTHNKEIFRHDGYIFFPDQKSHSRRMHIHAQKISQQFRQACEKAELQVIYGKAENSDKPLHLYSTHSLRHSGITDFYIKTNNIVLTMRYARHQNMSTTLTYIHHTEEDMRKAIESSDVRVDPEQFAEFLRVYHAFQEAQKERKTINA